LDNYTVVDNTFLNEFLPGATGDDVKVYLYGLSLCSNPNVEDNCLDTISKVLSLTEEQVEKSFAYWEEMGLVQIVSANPFEVKYLPTRAHSGSSKIRNKEKYSDFNKQMQEILSGRMITPVEYNEYYSLIETFHFEPDAVVLIAKYCTTIKSTAVSYPYILAVARDFASQGLKTFDAVESKFMEQEQSRKEIKQILNTLGIKREADIDERNLYLKWTNNLGFTQGVIVEVAKSLKKKGGFVKLDELLSRYYEQKLMSIEEITAFSQAREEMFEIAKTVSRNLGLYYQTYENIVSIYVSDWVNKGYDGKTLELVSSYCLRQNIHTLESMNVVIQKFFKLGLVSMQSIEQYISSILAADEEIKQVLDALGLVRSVSSYDRDLYKIWTTNWNFSLGAILQVAEISKGKANAFAYMNKILATLNETGKKTESEVAGYLKKLPKTISSNSDTKSKFNYEQREYTNTELTAVFDSLDDVEF
jgi:DNA replication protein DnaD